MDKFPGPVAVVSIESEGGFGGDFRGRFRPPEVSQCLKFPRPPDLSACQAPRPLADLNSFPSHFGPHTSGSLGYQNPSHAQSICIKE